MGKRGVEGRKGSEEVNDVSEEVNDSLERRHTDTRRHARTYMHTRAGVFTEHELILLPTAGMN